MLGAIIVILIVSMFCLWCVLRIASKESRIEEQYRLTKKKKGKK